MNEPDDKVHRIRPMLANDEEGIGEELGGDNDDVLGDDLGDMDIGADQPEAEDVGEEDAGVRVKSAPTQPSKTEKEKHDVTHCPYRSWCPTCVAGRGQK